MIRGSQVIRSAASANRKVEDVMEKVEWSLKGMEALAKEVLSMQSVIGMMAQSELKKAAFIRELSLELENISVFLHSATDNVSDAVRKLEEVKFGPALTKVQEVLEEHLEHATKEAVCGVGNSLVETRGESMILSGRELDIIGQCIAKQVSQATGPVGKFIRYLTSVGTSSYSIAWGAKNLKMIAMTAAGTSELIANPLGIVAVVGGAAWLGNALLNIYNSGMDRFLSKQSLSSGVSIVPRASADQWFKSESMSESSGTSLEATGRLSFFGFGLGASSRKSTTTSTSLVHRGQVRMELQPYVDPISALINLGDTIDKIRGGPAPESPEYTGTYIDHRVENQTSIGTRVELQSNPPIKGEARERAVATEVPRTVERPFNLRDFVFGAPYTVGSDIRERAALERK